MFQRVVENISRQLAFVLIRYIAVLGFQQGEGGVAHRYRNSRFHPLYRGTWYLTTNYGMAAPYCTFPSAISRYLVSDPTRKTPPLTSGGGNGLHTPRRIDHIPTFASLNHDKNTRSTHYTPNAGIEFSQAGFAPPGINPVQNCI